MDRTLTEKPDAAPGQLVDVIAGVCAQASMPALVIRLGRESGSSSAQVTGRPVKVVGCHALPVMHVGEDFTDEGQAEVCGAAAHEAAHIALGHPGTRRRLARCGIAAVIAAVVASIALPGQVPFWVSYLTGAVFYVTLRWTCRRQEYQADASAVEILDRAQLPGRAYMTATLTLYGKDPAWIRLGGWLLATHPLMSRRLAAFGESA